jgi:YHS domain-containing protein
MDFIVRIFRFLFWVLVVSWGVRLLRWIVGRLLRNSAAAAEQSPDATAGLETPGASRRLVRDPVCGMHVDETLSIPLREDGELLHFCSLACRDAHLGNVKKFAANG